MALVPRDIGLRLALGVRIVRQCRIFLRQQVVHGVHAAFLESCGRVLLVLRRKVVVGVLLIKGGEIGLEGLALIVRGSEPHFQARALEFGLVYDSNVFLVQGLLRVLILQIRMIRLVRRPPHLAPAFNHLRAGSEGHLLRAPSLVELWNHFIWVALLELFLRGQRHLVWQPRSLSLRCEIVDCIVGLIRAIIKRILHLLLHLLPKGLPIQVSVLVRYQAHAGACGVDRAQNGRILKLTESILLRFVVALILLFNLLLLIDLTLLITLWQSLLLPFAGLLHGALLNGLDVLHRILDDLLLGIRVQVEIPPLIASACLLYTRDGHTTLPFSATRVTTIVRV